ncbi:selenocysteine-specific translation elongation factor [Helicobacter salomonis]|uniref:selenocysteine-specific translation elongation factor n=1 Tax=Helicobacter salomonis TaxID=56878 RepID=UPI000CF02844|nr:selenocysteine-specific translation elongation factor [Helicobacter salomonis]
MEKVSNSVSCEPSQPKAEYFLLGTCGHVDHGKSALIKALSGFEGDTSAHEREAGMTIDLSFSNLEGMQRTLGFVDVPGHQSLVATMISGSFALDAGLLVIDAHEGIREQTLEHMLICSLLQIPCIIVISKIDKCAQTQNLEHRIHATLKQHNITLIALFKCSIYDEGSIQKLKDFLLQYPLAKKRPTNALKDLFRLYIDRVFVVQGRGVVVSGTLLGGQVRVHENLYALPLEKAVRVKTLHQHGREVVQANIHERVALHLGGIKAQELRVGMLLSHKGILRGFNTLDVALLAPPDTPSLKHNQVLSMQIGTLRCQAKFLHLESHYGTLITSQSVFACYGDRIILSHQGRVWGAALILNPIADPLKKPLKLALLHALETQDFPQAFAILSKAHQRGLGLLCATQRFALTQQLALEIARKVPDTIVDTQAMVLYPKCALENLVQSIKAVYTRNVHALLSVKGICAKQSHVSVHLATLAFKKLEEQGYLQQARGLWMRKGAKLEQLQESLQNRLYASIKCAGFAPEAPYNLYHELDMDRQAGDEALKALCRVHKVVRLCHNVFVEKNTLDSVVNLMQQLLSQHGYIDIALLKTQLHLSRKFLIAYLEYLDRLDQTINRDGRRTPKS